MDNYDDDGSLMTIVMVMVMVMMVMVMVMMMMTLESIAGTPTTVSRSLRLQ